MIKPLIKILKARLDSWERSKYNEFTIEEYFRRKGYFIGRNNRLYVHSFGSEPYLVRIGNHCTIAAGVTFVTHDGGAWIFREEIPGLNVFGKIEIKDNCFIGIRSILMPNVTIGPNAVVGAGSVVTKDVPANTVVAGVPARVICSADEYKEKCARRWRELKLEGSREMWEKQLVEYFWGSNKK